VLEGMKQNAFKPKRRVLYAFALAGEIFFLYAGFNFLLLGYMPPKHRFIGSAVFFPLAALTAWWGGWLSIRNFPPECRTEAKIIKTIPALVFLGVCLVTIYFITRVLLGDM